MSVAYYPCLEKDIDGFETIALDGKSLAKASDQLASIAEQLKVMPLEAFLGAVPDLEMDIEVEELWFEPIQGLATVEGLLGYLQQHLHLVSGQDDVLNDLQHLKEILDVAHKHQTRWHLAIDF